MGDFPSNPQDHSESERTKTYKFDGFIQEINTYLATLSPENREAVERAIKAREINFKGLLLSNLNPDNPILGKYNRESSNYPAIQNFARFVKDKYGDGKLDETNEIYHLLTHEKIADSIKLSIPTMEREFNRLSEGGHWESYLANLPEDRIKILIAAFEGAHGRGPVPSPMTDEQFAIASMTSLANRNALGRALEKYKKKS